VSAGFLPYGRQWLDERDIAAVTEVLRSDWLTTGPAVEAFERALAERLDVLFACACSSGTAALHLALAAAGIGAGDRAIVPSLTFLATANAVRFLDAEVVFADVDPETGLMGPAQLESALERAGDPPPRVVLPVALAGQCADPPAIRTVAAARGMRVIEDACHALGSTYTAGTESHPVGACHHSDLACFSFHPVKTIATGEGGAVTTRDPALHARLLRLRSHGIIRDPDLFESTGLAFDTDGRANPWYYEMPEIGFNYRLTDIQSALGLSQLRRLDMFVARRRELVARYDAALAPLAPVLRPAGREPGCVPGWHLYVVLVDFAAIGLSRARIMAGLGERGIGAQVHYLPVHMQPYYRRRYGEQSLPGAERYYAGCLSLPLFPAMADEDVDWVVQALVEVIG